MSKQPGPKSKTRNDYVPSPTKKLKVGGKKMSDHDDIEKIEILESSDDDFEMSGPFVVEADVHNKPGTSKDSDEVIFVRDILLYPRSSIRSDIELEIQGKMDSGVLKFLTTGKRFVQTPPIEKQKENIRQKVIMVVLMLGSYDLL